MPIDRLTLNLDVVLGKTSLPLGVVLRMGRGAVVALDGGADDLVEIRANGMSIATGRVVVQGDAIAIEVVELIARPVVSRTAGARIGSSHRHDDGAGLALAA